MKPEEIQRLRVREPFVPFRLVLQDGRSYDVVRRDLIMVWRDLLTIGLAIDPISGLPEQTVHVSPAQVVRAEDMQPAA